MGVDRGTEQILVLVAEYVEPQPRAEVPAGAERERGVGVNSRVEFVDIPELSLFQGSVAVEGMGQFRSLGEVLAVLEAQRGGQGTRSEGVIPAETAVVAEQVPSFVLPDLVAVERIVAEKGEVGKQLEPVAAVKYLLANHVLAGCHRDELHVEIGATGFATLAGVDGAKETRQARGHGPVGNLPGVVPAAPERRGRQGELGVGAEVSVVFPQ